MNATVKPFKKSPYGSRRVQQLIKRIEAKDLDLIVEYYIQGVENKIHTEARYYLHHLRTLPPTLILSQRQGKFVLPLQQFTHGI